MGPWLRAGGTKKNINFDVFLRFVAEFGLAGLVGQVSGPPWLRGNFCSFEFTSAFSQWLLSVCFRSSDDPFLFWGPRAPNASILESFWVSGNVPARLGRPVGARGGSD